MRQLIVGHFSLKFHGVHPNKAVTAHDYLVGGCLLTPLKNDGVKVSWDDEIPN